MLVTVFVYGWLNLVVNEVDDVDDQNGKICHQNFEPIVNSVVINIDAAKKLWQKEGMKFFRMKFLEYFNLFWNIFCDEISQFLEYEIFKMLV